MNTNDPVRTLLEKLALHVRPTCTELYDEIQSALTTEQASDTAWINHPQTIEAKRQWDAVADALGADKDDPDAVLAAAQASVQDDEYLSALDDLWKRVGNDDPLYRSFLRFVNTASMQTKMPDGWHLEVRPYFDTNAVFAVNENGAAIWIAAAPSPKVEG